MGKIKHLTKVLELFEKSLVVDIVSIKRILGEKNNYVYLMLNNLVQQGKIHRLTRGFYSTSEDPSLLVFCFKPAYLGLQEALTIHNLWEQETNTIVVTTNTVREGLRQVSQNNVLLRRIPSSLFFGFEYQEYGGIYLPVSNLEKTLLDLVYFKQPLDQKIISLFKQKIDCRKLSFYLKKYDVEIKDKLKAMGFKVK